MPGSEPARLLPWDSEFWDLTIGRVEGGTLDEQRAREVDDWAERNDVACVYFLARSDEPRSALAAARSGFRLVDVRVELARAADGSEGGAVRPARADDLPALRAIARASHRDTRFYADPGFPDDRCDDFYGVWIERSFEGWADAVLVAGDAEGYVTCHADEDASEGSIGLIAVAESARGRGLGQELVRGAVSWMREHGLATASVVTQGRNVAAQRTFQRCGFITRALDLWFHKWYER